MSRAIPHTANHTEAMILDNAFASATKWRNLETIPTICTPVGHSAIQKHNGAEVRLHCTFILRCTLTDDTVLGNAQSATKAQTKHDNPAH